MSAHAYVEYSTDILTGEIDDLFPIQADQYLVNFTVAQREAVFDPLSSFALLSSSTLSTQRGQEIMH
jgi:hypothetical protein